MKRLIAITLVMCMMLSILTGCGIGSTQKEAVTEKTMAYEEEEGTKDSDILSPQTYTLAQLQADFKQFQNVIETKHPKIYADEKELARLYEKQYQQIADGMEEIEFYRLLSPIVEKVNCVHTFLDFSKEYKAQAYSKGNYLPLTVKVVEDRAYVYQSLLSSGIPVGSEILSINNRTIKDIISVLLDNISADGSNTSTKYYLINESFNDVYFQYIGSPEQFSIVYKEKPDSKCIETLVSASSKEQIDNAVKSLSPVEESDKDMYYHVFEKDYAILAINYFDGYKFSSRERLKESIDEFFSRVSDEKIPNVILDLRDNWGGDPSAASHLFSYLIKKPSPYFAEDVGSSYDMLKKPIPPAKNSFNGKLYTLINGASSSTTGHLCALLKFHKAGTFIGEESGGSYVCSDSSENFFLNNTKIKFRCATEVWQVAVTDMPPGRGIIPDYVLTPTVQDYVDSKDIVLEFAVKMSENTQ